MQALRSIADALDVKPFNSQMWREYREAIEALVGDGGDDDTIGKLLEDLRAPVRDTAP